MVKVRCSQVWGGGFKAASKLGGESLASGQFCQRKNRFAPRNMRMVKAKAFSLIYPIDLFGTLGCWGSVLLPESTSISR